MTKVKRFARIVSVFSAEYFEVDV